MNCELIYSGANTGEFNMKYDIELAEKVNDNNSFFRLYEWLPYCVSLGANQSFDDVDIEKIKSDKIDLVKRPTGGRAILHAEEITYSFAIPTSSGLTSHEIYNRVSNAIVRGLKLYDERLEAVELENLQPDFANLLKQPQGKICFSSTAKSEIKFNGKKIVGSAQRKMKNSILQHGSILIGKFHRRLAEYILSSGFNENDFEEKTIEIETILDEKVDKTRLINCLFDGFINEWSEFNFVNEKLAKETFL
ncbi:MAG: lipoate--protein ligase family protein [Ignavibacteriales bacterium]